MGVSELKDSIIRPKQNIEDCLGKKMQWHFHPPSFSRRSGVWQRIIRSVWKVLIVLTRDHVVTYESLGSRLAEVERILNKRPLVPVSFDAKGQPLLKPNSMFLPRHSNGLPGCGGIQRNYSHRWKQLNHLVKAFRRQRLKDCHFFSQGRSVSLRYVIL